VCTRPCRYGARTSESFKCELDPVVRASGCQNSLQWNVSWRLCTNVGPCQLPLTGEVDPEESQKLPQVAISAMLESALLVVLMTDPWAPLVWVPCSAGSEPVWLSPEGGLGWWMLGSMPVAGLRGVVQGSCRNFLGLVRTGSGHLPSALWLAMFLASSGWAPPYEEPEVLVRARVFVYLGCVRLTALLAPATCGQRFWWLWALAATNPSASPEGGLDWWVLGSLPVAGLRGVVQGSCRNFLG
jgi:hypothetical protein